MTRREYPMIREHGMFGRKARKRARQRADECVACGQPPVAWIRIAWDYMRGNDDEPVKVCLRHKSMAHNTLRKFLAHAASKDRFLGRQEPQQ